MFRELIFSCLIILLKIIYFAYLVNYYCYKYRVVYTTATKHLNYELISMIEFLTARKISMAKIHHQVIEICQLL